MSEYVRMVLCTTNAGKSREVRALLPKDWDVLDLDAIGQFKQVEESADSLEGNALLKARQVFKLSGEWSLADDTGLEVDALDGAPGVRSARFAGSHASDRANVQLLLEKMTGVADRKARFRTVLALVGPGGSHCFEGVVEGSISRGSSGTGGFGYDPVFVPEGFDRTFADLPNEVKLTMSHRSKALLLLIAFVNSGGLRVS